MNSLRKIDLNLLLTLDTLLAEQNVTRAAERLHFSQPSISVHLAKLRGIFGDPLLMPGPRGMRPTARAEALRAPLRDALAALAQAVAPSAPFEPSSAQHVWKVAASDNSAQTILLPLLARLRVAAPGSRLAMLEVAPRRIARLAERGDIDLALHTLDDAPAQLRCRPLFKERYVLAGREGHPRLKRRPTLAQFCALEHVIVSPEGGGFVGVTDQALAEQGLTRRVVLSVPHFLFVLSALASSDLVAMLPERLVRGVAGIKVVEPPVQVPGFEMAMYWPERVHRDPAHEWLRGLIVDGVR